MTDEWDVLADMVSEAMETAPKALHRDAYSLDRLHAELIGYKEGAASIWNLLWAEGAVSPEAHRGWSEHLSLLHGRWQAVFSMAADLQGKIARAAKRGKKMKGRIDPVIDMQVAVSAFLSSGGKRGAMAPAIRAALASLNVPIYPSERAHIARVSRLIGSGEVARRVGLMIHSQMFNQKG